MASAGVVAFILKYDWISGSNYTIYNLVYYGGSTYVAKNNITGGIIAPDTDTTNWQLFAHGYIAENLSAIDATDTSGLIGTAGETVSSQALMDKIADMVADKLILKTAISNQQVNDATKVTGSALSYQMNQAITDLNSNFVDAKDYDLSNSNVQLQIHKDKTGLIHLYCYVFNNTSAGSTLYTIPADVRPTAPVSRLFWLPTSDSAWGTHNISISTSGNITTDATIYRGNIIFTYR